MPKTTEVRALRRAVACCMAGFTLAMGGVASTGQAASSSTVVTATVPSATSIDASGCAPGMPGVTQIGVVLPGSNAVTTNDCSVAFGSSNDTSSLRISQNEGFGSGMWRAARSTLDTDFGGGWIEQSHHGGNDYSYDVVVQDDGKIVAASYVWSAGLDMKTTRRNVDGSLDTTWGGTGVVTTDISGTDRSRGLDVTDDGIVVVGEGNGNDAAIARYTNLGAPHPDFNAGAPKLYTLGTGALGGSVDDSFWAVEVQADGAYHLAGLAYNTSYDSVIARVLPDGSYDPAFNGGSPVTLAASAGNDSARDIATGPDGTIYALIVGPAGRFLYAVDSSGLPVATFGVAGLLALDIPGNWDSVQSLLVQPNGRIVVGAYYGSVGALYGLTPTGAPDPTFGDGTGRVIFGRPPGVNSQGVDEVLELPDGRLLGVGYSWNGISYGVFMGHARADGTLDSDGGSAGGVDAFFPPSWNSSSWLTAAALGPDGQVAISGQTGPSGAINSAMGVLAGVQLRDYQDGVYGFTAGTDGMFAACLRDTNATSPAWPEAGTCTNSDGANWHGVAPAPERIASSASGSLSTAHLRFGMRTATSQPPGTYIAPITFDVVAPSV